MPAVSFLIQTLLEMWRGALGDILADGERGSGGGGGGVEDMEGVWRFDKTKIVEQFALCSDGLRAHTGAAPVTKRSGKRAFFVHMRYACKRRLRQAVYHWSRTSLQHDAAARAYYDRVRARGHSHARALRSVADRWLRILVAMLRSGTLYDPSHFAQIPV